MINDGLINDSLINGGGENVNTLSISASIAKPSLEMSFEGSDGNTVAVTLPKPTVTMQFGGRIAFSLAKPSLSMALTPSIMFRASVSLTKPVVSATMDVSRPMSVGVDLPKPVLTFYSGGRITASIAKPVVSMAVSVSRPLSIASTLPKPSVSAAMTTSTLLSISISLSKPLSPSNVILASLSKPVVAMTLTAAVTRTLQAYGINIRNNAMTDYSNYPFEFVVRFQGKNYGFNSSGAYLLEGGDDNGTNIDAYLEVPENNFGIHNEKRVNSVYVGSNTPGKLVVTAIADNDKTANVATAFTGRNRRAKMPKGLKGVYWGFRVSNTNGNRMDVDSLQILPEITGRKVK